MSVLAANAAIKQPVLNSVHNSRTTPPAADSCVNLASATLDGFNQFGAQIRFVVAVAEMPHKYGQLSASLERSARPIGANRTRGFQHRERDLLSNPRLGHSKPSVTLDTYGHLMEGTEVRPAYFFLSALFIAIKKSEPSPLCR
jgi:hypothetical protein